MKPKNDLARPEAGSPAPRKRFRLQKLESRIAPKGHLNPQSKWVGDGNGAYTSSTY